MKYSNMHEAIFKERINRFIARIEINGQEELAHVKNTGRCKELLIPGVKVYVHWSHRETRKTKYDLIGVVKGNRLINMDSQAPNKVVHEWLMSGALLPDITKIKPESTYKQSRFDFYVETKQSKIYIEVKGATLEENGVVMFPDAPTERGIKHINELAGALEEGFETYIIFVIQMKDVLFFTPNDEMHKAFGDSLRRAAEKGVKILAVDCHVTLDELTVGTLVPVRL